MEDGHPVRLSYSAELAAIQQCFPLTTNQRTVLSATINQRNEQVVHVGLLAEVAADSDVAVGDWISLLTG
jgi:tRNA A37 N6-isopentenylltransferase MiaA